MAEQDQYWSGRINFAGLGNGTDFGKMIDGLIKAEGTHKRRLEKWRTGWEDKNKELQALNKKVLSLETALKKIDTKGELLGKRVSTSHSELVTITASGDAAFDSHTVQIKQLAKTDLWASSGAGFDKLDSKITTSNTTFRFSYGGKSVELNVPKNTTVEQFVNNLNNHQDLRGKVRASAVSNGDSFFLQLKGLELGQDSTLVLSSSGIPGLQVGHFANIRKAQDALIKVDGFPPGTDKWMRRNTNAVTDAIEGVTLNLRSANPDTTVSVTVSHDHEQTKKSVVEFLKAMNEVRVHIKKLTEVTKKGSNNAKGSILTGNYGVEMVSQKLKLTISSPGVGFNLSGPLEDAYSALASVGIKSVAKTGSVAFRQLELDEKVFDKALKENPQAVAALFVTDHSISTQSTDFSPGSIVRGVTPPGKHDIAYTISDGKITSATINGEPAKISGWDITGTHKNAAGLGLSVTNQTNGTYTGSISIRQGKILELLKEVDALTDSTNGTLRVIEKNYDTIIDNINKKIEREDKRIGDKERRLKNRFARLDATLGRYEKLQQSLKAQISKMGGVK